MGTRDEILDAADKVLRSLGLAKATTKEIAKAAGYSEATLYKHFTDKAEIFLAVLTERMPDLRGMLAELTAKAGNGRVKANLVQVAGTATRFYTQTFPVAVSLFSSQQLLAAHRQRMAELDAGPMYAHDGLVGYLRAEQRHGGIRRGADLNSVASLLLGACFQRAFFVNYSGVPDGSVDRFASKLVATLLDPILPA